MTSSAFFCGICYCLPHLLFDDILGYDYVAALFGDSLIYD